MNLNGRNNIVIKTLHGKINFSLQRFTNKRKDENLSYFDLSGQFCNKSDGYVSDGLKEFSCYYSNRLSYEEFEKLINRTTGERLLSDQKIYQIVLNKANEISNELLEEFNIVKRSDKSLPEINSDVKIYEKNEKEVLIFDDGIQVKKQKDKRFKKISADKINTQKKKKCINTDIMMLEKKDGSFEYIISGIDKAGKDLFSLEDIARTKLIKEYGGSKEAVNIVAITDGAKNIRLRLKNLFNKKIRIILDWYHLNKKVRELMSMVAKNKEEKIKHIEFLLLNLWNGKVDVCLSYLFENIDARNKTKLNELYKYIEKHKNEIIDYELRKKAGKSIGSGRMEKGVDLSIGNRQKKKGMSWGKAGSKSLAILKIVELNKNWNDFWFTEKIVA